MNMYQHTFYIYIITKSTFFTKLLHHTSLIPNTGYLTHPTNLNFKGIYKRTNLGCYYVNRTRRSLS